MTRYSKYIYLTLWATILIATGSCVDDDFIKERESEQLVCITATTQFSGNNSRAIYNEGNREHVKIDNYCLLYFNDIANTGSLITALDLGKLESQEYVYLPTSTEYLNDNRDYYAVLLGNVTRAELETQGLIPGTTTVNDLKGMVQAVTATGNNPTDATTFTWSGFLPVSPGTKNLSFKLNPNMAKITAKITNNSSESEVINVQIKDVVDKVRYAQNALSKVEGGKLFDVNTNTYLSETSDGTTTTTNIVGYLDYEIEELNLGTGESQTISWYVPHNQCGTGTRPKDGNAGSFPAGQSPTYIEIDTKRNVDFMDVAYKIYPGTGAGADYENLDNFNILADNQYSLNITITDDGVTYNTTSNLNDADNAGIHVEKIILPGNSNCYMIHPKYSDSVNPAAVGTDNNTTVYELPAFERINEFWSSTDGDASNVIGDDTEWVMEVIWQDIATRAIYFTDETGSKDDDEYNGVGKNPAYFKLCRETLTDTYSKTSGDDTDIYGNILVGVKKVVNGEAQDGYLWSWHLWLTDYNPDAAPAPSMVSGTSNVYGFNYLYARNTSNLASGTLDKQGEYYATTSSTSYTTNLFDGNVQHYNSLMTTPWTSKTPTSTNVTTAYNSSSSVWDGSGIYAEKWMMDRNIGAQSPNNSSIKNPEEAFGMYYQYGRKDPFSYKNIYDINGNLKPERWTPESGPTTLKSSIKNPNTFYTLSSTTAWANDASANAWYNPDWNHSGYTRGDKTLFDPCPPGWCIPVHEVYSFAVVTATNNRLEDGEAFSSTHACLEVHVNTNSATSGPIIVDPLRGYFELINTTTEDDCRATFPLAGYIMGDGTTAGTITGISSANTKYETAINNGQIRGCLWTLEHDNDGRGRLLQVQPTTTHPITSATVSNTNPILNNGRYYKIHYVGASIRNWVSARGQNVRCIQEPD